MGFIRDNKNNALTFYTLFLLNSIIVLILAFPNLGNPPRSDYWTMFYFFSKIKSITAPGALVQIAKYRLFEQPTFLPLANIILYSTFSIFKDNIVLYNLFSTLIYILFIFLVYKLALRIAHNLWFIFLMVATFSILVTHFDIVCWPYHSYIIIGMIFFILSFLSLLNYLNSGSLFRLSLFIIFSLLGSLCYEAFILWPLGFLFLLNKYKLQDKSIKHIFLSVCMLYYIYGLLFFIFIGLDLDHFRTVYVHLRGACNSFYLANGINSILSNILFISIIANLFPPFIFPLNIVQNVEFGDILDRIFGYFLSKPFHFLYIWIIFIFLGIFLWKLRKKKNFTFALIFLFNMCSSLFIISTARDMPYILGQPRYQFIFNFNLCILLICFLEEPFNRASRLFKLFFVIFAFYIFSIHTFYTYKTVKLVSQELMPIKIMFGNIHTAIEKKIIHKGSTLYIPPEIVDNFPGLCWNHDMDVYIIPGRYEYIFKDKLDYFSFSEEDAEYIVDKQSLKVLPLKP